jgi:hypothetical protein
MGGGPAEGWDTRVIANQVDNWRMSAVGTYEKFGLGEIVSAFEVRPEIGPQLAEATGSPVTG